MSDVKNITLTDGFVFRIGKLDRPRGWPDGKSPADSVSRIEWEETESGVTVTAYTPSETEGEPETESQIEITQAEIDALAKRVPEPDIEPLPPLKDRLTALNAGSPVALRAALAPLQAGVKSLLDIGDVEAAQKVIEDAPIPEQFEPVRQKMLAEFKKEETTQ